MSIESGSGTFKFDLKDQLDHGAAAGDNGILTLNLTGASPRPTTTATRSTLDADSIRVVVENDIPAVVGSATVSIRVDEDDHWSTVTGDLSNGITDGDGETDEATFSWPRWRSRHAGCGRADRVEPDGAISGARDDNRRSPCSRRRQRCCGTDGGALVGFANVGGGAASTSVSTAKYSAWPTRATATSRSI